MNTNMTLSVLGLYNYDDTIFDNMEVPNDIDKTTLINNILMECAEFEVLYPDVSFFKFAIKNWSEKEIDVWNKLYALWSVSANDLINEYDYSRTRTPNITKTKTGTETDTPTGSIIDSGTIGNTTTDSVSAYNSNTFENREQSVINGTNGNTRSFNQYQDETEFDITERETGTETITETGHKKPIADVLKESSEIALNNLYDYIINSFMERFCLLIY